MRIGNKRYWWFQLCGWGAFVLVHLFFTWTFGEMETEKKVRMFFSRIGIFVLTGLVVTHIMRMVILRTNLLQKRLEKQIFRFSVITAVFTLIGSTIIILLHRRFNYLNKEQVELYESGGVVLLIAINAFNVFIYYSIWNGIYFMYHYIDKSQKQQLDTLQLESLVKELELKTIKAHINPHFIFNALNSIRALVDENPQRARQAITELSTILRSSMQSEKTEAVAMEKELDIVKDYLALENMRFEDRLRIEYEIDGDTLNLPVPPMMLQTLVENAIKHGISKQVQGGVVRIVSSLEDNLHVLSVQNTGKLNGATTGVLSEEEAIGRGFGLSSTTNRLSLLYGNKASFEIKQVNPTLVEARVTIPVDAA
ncbi:MAG: sensor histidine kinase [Chitinophagaceae bacterium]|nr:MAG: sensor histidine kinase [Chitinophagaceae bacterium]